MTPEQEKELKAFWDVYTRPSDRFRLTDALRGTYEMGRRHERESIKDDQADAQE